MHQKLRFSLWLCFGMALLTYACKKENAAGNASQLYPVKDNSRWGYMDAEGKTVVTPAYDYTWDFVEGMGRFKDKGKYGFINTKGEVVIPASYAYAADFAEGYARINIADTAVTDPQYDGYNLDSDWTFTDVKGVVFGQTFAHIENFKYGVAAVKEQSDYDAPTRYATVANGQIVVEDRVTQGVFDFNRHKLAPASDSETGKLGMIDETENWVVQPSFDNLEPYHEGLATARKNNRYGYIDMKGNWIYSRVVPINQYVSLTNDFKPFNNGLAAAKTDTDTYQYIGTKGEVAFATRFKNAGNFTTDGYAIVTVDAGTGLIDKQGNWVIKPNLNIQSVANGIAVYYNDKSYAGARDIKTQKDILPATYSAIDQVGNLLRVRNTGATYGYINGSGEFVIQPQYNTAWAFENGKAVVNIKDQYFYIDASGHTLGNVPADKNPYGIGNVLYALYEGDKYGFYSNGERALPAVYDFATDFEGNVARINIGAKSNEDAYEYTGGQWGLIDAKGKPVLGPRYTLIMPFNNGTALVNMGGTASYWPCEEECLQSVYYTCTGGTWGLIKADGTEAVKPQYDYLIPFGKNFLASLTNQWSIIDATGKTVYAGPLEIDINGGAKTEEESFDPEASMAYAVTDYNEGQIPQYQHYNFIEARENGRTGVISPEGEWLLKPEFDNVIYHDATAATPFTEGKITVSLNERWGAADASGKLVIPAEYAGIRNFSNGFAAVRIAERWGFIDERNTRVVDAIYANVRNVQGNVAIVQKQENSGESVIDMRGKEIIAISPGVLLAPEGFINGLCTFSDDTDGKTAKTVITATGKNLFNRSFSDIQIYKDLVYVQMNDKWAMASHDGRILTSFDYTWIEPSGDQPLLRCNTGGEPYYEDMGTEGVGVYGGLWGIIDKTGKLRAPLIFAEIGTFNSGLAPARSGKDLDEVGYFDRTGKPVRAIKK